MKRLLIVTAFIAIGLVESVQVVAAAQLGSVLFVKSNVEITRPGVQKPIVPKVGDPIYEKDKITTDESGKIELIFANGNMLWVSSMSELVLKNVALNRVTGAQNSRIELKKGRLSASVEKIRDRNSSFQVETGLAVAAVKGTQFEVENSGDDEVALSVFSGVVAVKSLKTLAEIEVPSGNQINVNTDGKLGDLTSVAESKMAENHAKVEVAKESAKLALVKLVEQLPSETSVVNAPPVAPTGLEYKIQSSGKIALFWNRSAESDISHYLVFLNGSSRAKAGVPEFEDSAITNGQSRRYAVQAVDTSGNVSLLSDAIEIDATQVDPQAPPERVTGVMNPVTGMLQLNWLPSKAFQVVSYDIYVNRTLAGSSVGTSATLSLAELVNKNGVRLSRSGGSFLVTVRSVTLGQKQGKDSEPVEVELPESDASLGVLIINSRSVAGLETLRLFQDDLNNNAIVLSGTASSKGFNTIKLEVSIDNGATWTPVVGTYTWAYSFVPKADSVYSFKMKATNSAGIVTPVEGSFPTITYISQTKRSAVEQATSELISAFNSRDIKSIHSNLSLDFEPDALTFEDGCRQFWQAVNSVTISIRSFSSVRQGDQIVAVMSWTRTYSMTGRSSSISGVAEFTFGLEGGRWKLRRVSGDSPFAFPNDGPGQFSINLPVNLYVSKSDVTIGWTIPRDNGFGIRDFDIYVDSGSGTFEKVGTVAGTLNRYVLSGLSEGVIKVYVKSNDYVGRYRDTSVVQIEIDAQPPEVPFK